MSQGTGINFGKNLSASQIAAYASRAGFAGNDLITAVSIALAESAGNPSAVGDSGNSIGLWQIDVAYHPEFSGQILSDAQTNADAAFSVYSQAGNSFTPWSTFNNGRYQAFLSVAQNALLA